MTAQNSPHRLLSQQSSEDIGGPSTSTLNAPISDSCLEASDRSFPQSSPQSHLVEDSEEEDLYRVSDAHGTLAPITKDQEHYDSRRGEGDFKVLDFCDDLVGRKEELKILWNVFNGTSADSDGKTTDITDESASASGAPKKVVFIKGYSGVGKSALVRNFVAYVKARIEDEQVNSGGDTGGNILFGSGKFNDSGTPFSAFNELLQGITRELKAANLTKSIQTAIAASPEIGINTEGNTVLMETWPALGTMLDGPPKDKPAIPERRKSSFNLASSTVTMNSIKEYTQVFLELLCANVARKDLKESSGKTADQQPSEPDKAKQQPDIIMFLDDLQWADSPSMDLLTHLLSEARSLNIMFLCAYRSNEVDKDHPLQLVIDEATGNSPNASDRSLASNNQDDNNTFELELFPLSHTSIREFVATTLDKDPEDVTVLSEAIYKKTMGNIFYVKQAMEELVRKNALYYDLMCFEWLFTDSKDANLLEDYISDDVVSSIRDKIGLLDEELQRVLIIMGYVPNNTLEVDVLRQLLASTGREMGFDELIKLLNVGVDEGMLLLSSENGHYILSHDKIRQASKECIEGEERDILLLQLANVLSTMYEEDQAGMEWCIYVAVDYLNSFKPGLKSDAFDLSKLNLKVASCARKKGATNKVYTLLGHGLRCLKAVGKVWVEYDLTLDIYSGLIESSNILGKFDESRLHVREVLNHAKTLDDKLVAYRYQITLTHVEARDYVTTLKEGIKVLGIFGYGFPALPTAADCIKEEMKMKVALHSRPYSCLLDQPLVENPLMELFKDVAQYALFSGNDRLLKIISWKAIRLGLQKGIDRHFHTILACLGNTIAKEKEIKTAFEIANTAVLMAEKSREDKGNYAYTQLVAYQGVLFQLQSFRSGVDVLLQCYKDLKLDGQIDPALGSALMHFLAIFASGITVGSLVESKLIMIEEFARRAGIQAFVVLFQMQRQFMLNLWKASDNPTKLNGVAFNEDEFLAGLDSTSKVYSMTLRDTSTFRLILAFVYHDQDSMAKMLDILRVYPMVDVAVPRLHLRLTFMGLSALYMMQQSKKDERFDGIAKSCLLHFKELTKLGSVNAKPIYHLMLAMKQPSIKSYELAINSCTSAQLPHMEAIAKEHYGLHLCRDRNATSIGQDYLVSAYWLYCNWGADAKATVMRGDHACIKTASKNQANSRIEKALSTQSGNNSKREQVLDSAKKKRFSLSTFSRKPKSIARRKSKSSRDLLTHNS